MKLGYLRELIANAPADWEVYLSSDAEGNSYRKLALVETGGTYDSRNELFSAKPTDKAGSLILIPFD